MENCLGKDTSFDKLISKLRDELDSRTETDSAKVNALLDKLNAFDFQNVIECNKQEAESLLCTCFSKIPPSETFLVAKCCNLTVNLVKRQSLCLDRKSLTLFLSWVQSSLKCSADVAFIDILEATDCVICSNSDFFEKKGESLWSTLESELEKRSNVTHPLDIKLLRIKTLHNLALQLPEKCLPRCFSRFMSLLSTQATTSLLSHAQVWKAALEGLSGICARGGDWIEESLGELIGAVIAGSQLGFHGGLPQLPKVAHPSVIAPVDPPGPSSESYQKPGWKKISRRRVKPVGKWTKEDELPERQALFEMSTLDYPPTSDSEQSDGEGGKVFRLSKEQARTRQAALNLLIQLVKVRWRKPFYGYYTLLLGGGGLAYNINHETFQRPRIAALTATTGLLTRGRFFFAQAQYSEGPFTSFSNSLSDLLCGLHSALCNQLRSAPSFQLAAPLFCATSTLISVTPYHRLRPSLLTSIFKCLLPYIKHKDKAIFTGVVECLIEIAVAVPSSSEHESIILSCASEPEQEHSWLVSFCLQNLKDGEENETCQVMLWQLIGGLAKTHISKIIPFYKQFEEILLRDLASPFKTAQRYACNALESVAFQFMNKEEFRDLELQLWTKLLQGPLVPILQSPTMLATDGCNCLANISPAAYANLKEETQILFVTLLYGCCYHEENHVRAAAVRTLGVFLLFPQAAQEQYVCDIKTILTKALSDRIQLVRIKASWAFGNLVDLIHDNQDADFIAEISFIEILDVCLSLANDVDRVRENIARAVGTLLLVLNESHLKESDYREAVNKSASFLIRSATSGNCMKMRWNACYALGIMLKNELFYSYTFEWQLNVINGLCGLLVKCSNFKVRLNATIALSVIPKREHYKCLHIKVWQALVDGLENAANMRDFREYQHQDELFRELCFALCHMATLLESEDLIDLETIIVYRIENLSQHMARFQLSASPEKSSIVLSAANKINLLEKCSKSASQKNSILALKEIFSLN